MCGMRGVGKSQLAAAYARDCEKAGWSLVGWMDASSRNELVAGLAELAVEMGIDEDGGEAAPEILAGRCVTQLNSGEGDRLIVFDNVDDFDDLAGLVCVSLSRQRLPALATVPGASLRWGRSRATIRSLSSGSGPG